MMDEQNNSEGAHKEAELNEPGITMVDVLQEEQELEDDAEAVLGAGDDSSCTYDKGYMKRQPLYACQTCIPIESEISAGICLGCSYHCHEGHDLVELYTKRHFTCDCGNSKFPETQPCKLLKDKQPINTENHYNHNFQGRYCTCNRPYPDPDDHIEDQMIQCIICEDWYHGRHLEVSSTPSEEEFSEMICGTCVSKMPVLKYYLGLSVTSVTEEVLTENVQVLLPLSPYKEDCETILGNNCLSNLGSIPSDNIETNNKIFQTKDGSCKLKKQKEQSYSGGAIFFNDVWRKELCSCISCKDLYAELKISFLIDSEDTVAYYESQGREKRHVQRGVQRELDALSSLDRITRTEVVHEYNNLSSSLRDYLKKFAENGKVVRDQDIREFFSGLEARKKQKNEGFQYFCK